MAIFLNLLLATRRRSSQELAAVSCGRIAMRHSMLESGVCGPLAQLVEQLTLNQRVPGSSPGRLTTSFQ
jgi:hypothetical protein